MGRNQLVKILAIESSCDETAAALLQVTNGYKMQPQVTILCNVVSSQAKLHAKYGGVYPELASREHVKNILPAINEAIKQCNNLAIKDIDYLAVTTGPGLIGSLLPGVNTAKTLAYIFNKPIYSIQHIEGHLYSNFVGEFSISNFQFPNKYQSQISKQLDNLAMKQFNNKPRFPLLALVVSGGHTSLVLMKNHLKYEIIGETLDDAAGEAFDKVAKLLNLGYPGGPAISKAASKGDLAAFSFPRSMVNRKDFDFSFSGLKTSVLYENKKHKLTNKLKANMAASFQQAVIDILISKTIQAAYKFNPKSICLCGGVSANKNLREQLKIAVTKLPWKVSFHMPPMELTTDNAAMVGVAAAYKIALGIKPTPWYNVNADANLKLN